MVDAKQHDPTQDADHSHLSRHWRMAISALLVFHLAAIVAPPLAFQTRPSPPVNAMFSTLRWYIDVLYLNHGYAFFAPEPEPSNLVEYTVEFDDGRSPITETFPDIDRHWPRLLYHRHFMLSEHLNAAFVFPEPPLEPERMDEQSKQDYREVIERWKIDVERWDQQRKTYEARWRSFEKHLLTKHDADRITMRRKRHLLPQLPVTNELDLRDERSYQYAGRDEVFPEPFVRGDQ